jgi:hypothetical protein
MTDQKETGARRRKCTLQVKDPEQHGETRGSPTKIVGLLRCGFEAWDRLIGTSGHEEGLETLVFVAEQLSDEAT